MQQQYATIRVVNRGSAGCWVVGYPRVTLLVGGRALGHAAVPAHSGAPALFLAPGRAATSSLHGPSTCNALLSDHARIAAPGQAAYTQATLGMRGCALLLDPWRAA